MPGSEQLTRVEKLQHFCKQLVRALANNTQAFSGRPDTYQQISRGMNEAEDFANCTEE